MKASVELASAELASAELASAELASAELSRANFYHNHTSGSSKISLAVLSRC